MTDPLAHLNPPQREAVLFRGAPLVVFAGAGSGKTRVITHRIADLVTRDRVAPWRILAVTFTNKAAGEMRERLERLCPGASHDLWVGTFHSVSARLLRRHADAVGVSPSFTIYDDGDQKALVTRIVRELGFDERRHPPRKLLWAIGQAKQEAKGPDALERRGPDDDVLVQVYREYEARLARAAALDFDDLLLKLVRAMEEVPGFADALRGRFDHILVDEFQDTNHVQARLVFTLAASHRNICVVGDDDQSIYRWRGADRRNILDFRTRFEDARVIKLEQNYRSTQRILRGAHSIIARNVDREPKTLWTENEDGAKILVVRTEDEREEARVVGHAIEEFVREGRSLDDLAVFYRTHAQSRVLEEALRARDLAYRVVGGTRFYERAEVKDLLAYLRLLEHPEDDVALLRVINVPARGIGKTTVEALTAAAAARGESVFGALTDPASLGLGRGPAAKLAAFRAMLADLTAQKESLGLGALAEEVLTRTGYQEALRAEDSPEADARLENLAELVGSLEEFEAEAEEPTLSAFLEVVTLDSGVAQTEAGRVTLMTVHAAKGLEFPVVMVAGLEEGMFPMKSSELWDDPEELEEERRLAYVALTRARERLLLTWAVTRRIYGQLRMSAPSRFLAELPQDDVTVLGGRASAPPPALAWRSPPAARADANAASTREARVEYDGDDVGLRRGMRVRHAKFGVGQVTAIGDGLPPRVSVEFPGWGTKQIVSTYLEPA